MYQSIVEAIFAHAKENPNHLCLVDDFGEITYEQMARKISCLASWFNHHGVLSGDRVLVESSQQINYLVIEYALEVIGAIFVPIERNTAPIKILSFITRINPKLVVLNKRHNEIDCITLAELTENYKTESEFEITSFPKANDISQILFTTGTTGTEKGIVLSFDNNVALSENVIEATGMKKDNVEFILSPFNHYHGLRRYYANMFNGSTVVMQDSIINIKNLFQKMDTYGVNSMDMVPSALSVILSLTANTFEKYKNVIRYIQLGAAPIPDKDKDILKSLLPNTLLLNMYGSTESGIACIYNLSGNNNKKNCIGKPSKNSTIILYDDDYAPINGTKDNPGLLACSSRANMLGYYEDATCDYSKIEEVIVSNDIAYRDEDGDIILLGRKDDVINVGGKKIAPKEIEDVARKLPYIKDCACIPVPDASSGCVPKLFVQLSQNYINDGFILNPLEISLFLGKY